MAQRNTGRTHFKKGTTGNPKGRPSIPVEIRDLKKLVSEELEQLISTLLRSTDAQIDALLADPAASRISKIVAQILEVTYKTGSMSSFDSLLNRVIGRVKETIEHTSRAPETMELVDGRMIVFANKKSEEE